MGTTLGSHVDVIVELHTMDKKHLNTFSLQSESGFIMY